MATTSKEGSRRVTYLLLVQGGSDNKYLTEVSLTKISQTVREERYGRTFGVTLGRAASGVMLPSDGLCLNASKTASSPLNITISRVHMLVIHP